MILRKLLSTRSKKGRGETRAVNLSSKICVKKPSNIVCTCGCEEVKMYDCEIHPNVDTKFKARMCGEHLKQELDKGSLAVF